MLKKLSLLVVAIIFFASVQAESIRFTTLNSSNGLPQDTVRAITQDQNGFMWFATEDGISRYDGHEFKSYRYDPDIADSLPENVAYQFLAEGENNLWVSTQGKGVAVLDQLQEKFSKVQDLPASQANQKIGEYASALYLRTKDEVLIGSKNGVFSVSTGSLNVSKQLVSSEQLGNKRVISALWEDFEKNLWIASEDGKLA